MQSNLLAGYVETKFKQWVHDFQINRNRMAGDGYLLLKHNLSVEQRITHSALHLVTVERSILALAFQRGRFYLP